MVLFIDFEPVITCFLESGTNLDKCGTTFVKCGTNVDKCGSTFSKSRSIWHKKGSIPDNRSVSVKRNAS